MLDDVGERLLKQPVDGRLEFGLERHRARRVTTRPTISSPADAPALEQRLDRRPQSEIVEQRRSQVGDDRAQVVGLQLDVLDGLTDRRLCRRAPGCAAGPRRAARAGRREPGASGRGARGPSAPARRRRRVIVARSRSASTLRWITTALAAEEAKVRSSCSSSTLNVPLSLPWSKAASTPTPAPRWIIGTSRAVWTSGTPSSSAPIRRCRETSEIRSACRSSSTRPEVESAIATRRPRVSAVWPAAAAIKQVVALAQHDQHRARVDQRAPALDDQLEHRVELVDAGDGVGDVPRRTQARAAPARPPCAGARSTRTAARSRSPIPAHCARTTAACSSSSVNSLPPPSRSGTGFPRPDHGSGSARRGRSPSPDGWPGNRSSAGGGRRRRAGAVEDLRSVRRAPRARAGGSRSARCVAVVDPGCDEALQLGSLLVEHPERGVPGAGYRRAPPR